MSPVTTMAVDWAMTEKSRRPTIESPKRARPMCSRNGVSGGIGNETPIEMAGIAEELQLVAVKAIAAVGGDVEDRGRAGDDEARPSNPLSAKRQASRCLGLRDLQAGFPWARFLRSNDYDGQVASVPLSRCSALILDGIGTRTEAMPAAVAA